MGGIGVLSLREYLLNCLCFPDLTQSEATIYEKILQVDKDKATLEGKAEINGEMWVFEICLSQMIMFCHFKF